MTLFFFPLTESFALFSARIVTLPATQTVKFFIINIDFFSSLYLVSLSFYIQPLQFQKYSEYWIRYSNENEIMPSPRTRLCSMGKRRKQISNKKKLIREIHNKFSMPFFPIFFLFHFFLGFGRLILLFDWHEIVCTRASPYLHANSYEYHGKRAWYDSNLIFIGVVQIFFSFIQLSNIEI